MGSAWEQGGYAVTTDDGTAVLECDACPCGVTRHCEPCDSGTVGGSLTLEFLAGTNESGDASGCAGNCDDWAGAWEGQYLDEWEKDALFADPDYTYLGLSGYANNCMYRLTEGLPCGAVMLLTVINYIMPKVVATAWTLICWPGQKAARISWNINHLDDPAFDHRNCLVWYQAGDGVAQAVVDRLGDPVPCDFKAIEDFPSKFVVGMNP